MRIDLTGKTAIVTGSTAGIGFAIAKGLAISGATVVINGRKQTGVDEALSKLKDALPNAQVRGVAADLTTSEGLQKLQAAEPKADILVNNLGIYSQEDFFETSDETWQKFFEINVLSGVRVSRAYIPGMVDQGWGRVVFISSESGLNIPPRHDPLRLYKVGQSVHCTGSGEKTFRYGCDRQCCVARTYPVRWACRDAEADDERKGYFGAGGGRSVCESQAAHVHYPAYSLDGRSCQHGGLRLLDSSVRHHGRGPACRRRYRRQYRLGWLRCSENICRELFKSTLHHSESACGGLGALSPGLGFSTSPPVGSRFLLQGL